MSRTVGSHSLLFDKLSSWRTSNITMRHVLSRQIYSNDEYMQNISDEKNFTFRGGNQISPPVSRDMNKVMETPAMDKSRNFIKRVSPVVLYDNNIRKNQKISEEEFIPKDYESNE